MNLRLPRVLLVPGALALHAAVRTEASGLAFSGGGQGSTTAGVPQEGEPGRTVSTSGRRYGSSLSGEGDALKIMWVACGGCAPSLIPHVAFKACTSAVRRLGAAQHSPVTAPMSVHRCFDICVLWVGSRGQSVGERGYRWGSDKRILGCASHAVYLSR